MARSVWKGSISFGLVNVPVEARVAVRDHDVHFHQLERRSGSRIRNQRIVEGSGKPVEADDIVMGFDTGGGRYVTFDKDELDALHPASTRAIEVDEFVALDEIDPVFFERTYWLVPTDEAAVRAYALLREAMERLGRVGIGTVVMREKQYLTAIRPLEGALAMSTMHFADEVVARSDVDGIPPRRKANPKELQLAVQLVDGLSGTWDPRRFHDTYTEELRSRIEAKDRGEEVTTTEVVTREPTEAQDLLAVLQASLDGARRPARRTPRSSSSGASRRRKAGARAKRAS